MQKRKPTCSLLAAFALVFVAAAGARAQEAEAARPQGSAASAPTRAEVNHEVHLHLLVTAEGAADAPKPPPSLDAVVRQLKAGLPPAEYRLAASFINRVRDGGGLEVRSAGGPGSGPAQPANSRRPPTLLQLNLAGVKLIDPSSPQPSINIQQFRLGMKVPVPAAADREAGGAPVIQYEDVGLSTNLSVREGEPTLVGTLNTGGPGQHFVVVITVRRAGR